MAAEMQEARLYVGMITLTRGVFVMILFLFSRSVVRPVIDETSQQFLKSAEDSVPGRSGFEFQGEKITRLDSEPFRDERKPN